MKCKKCGTESYHVRLCYTCRKKWVKTRRKAFQQAENELGKLCAKNRKALLKRVREIERIERGEIP